jgi:hypothetical protein
MPERRPNTRLRAVRIGMDLSQDAFAASLGRFMREELRSNVSPNGNLVGMWERGEARPGQVYRLGLMAYTGLPEWELGFAPMPGSGAGAAARRPRGADQQDADAARSIISTGMSLAGLDLKLRADVPDRISAGYAEEIQEAVEAYRSLVYRHGASRGLRQRVAGLLDRAAASISNAPDGPLRRSLLMSTADAAGLAAYVCRDLGLHGLAQQHYLLALQIAQAAGDRALVRHLVVRLAGHNIELTRPKDALAFLDVVRRADLSKGFTHGELSNQLAIEAWACAQAGLAERAVRAAALADGQAALAEERANPGWRIRHVTEAELCSLTGAGFTELARHDPRFAGEAIHRLGRALDLRGGESARNRSLDLISLAEAHLADRDLEQSLRVAGRAVESAQGSSSLRIRRRLGELQQRLRPHVSQVSLFALFEPGHA